MRIDKKLSIIGMLCIAVIFGQSFTKHPDDDHAINLKVLPKNTSEHDLHTIMRGYSMALGVRCGFCHVSEKVEGQERPKFDFASDNKPEKNIARSMMKMTQSINENYLAKITNDGHALEQITCVTCHMGRKTPIITTDSLIKKTDSVKKQ